jgi:phage host-nuclease inhibitor protein Gam
MPRKKNPANNYFHEGIEEAIQLYNKAESELERNRLFTIIYPALAKISEVYYNKIKPIYIEGEPLNIQMDCTAYLSERLFRIKAGKGKAFSYFTICAKNYYIFWNQKGYKDVQKTLSLDLLNENWDIADDSPERLQEIEHTSGLLNAFADYLEANKDKLTTAAARKFVPVIEEVIRLMRNVDSIEDFNRRTIMNNLTEINGVKVDRHYITKVFNRISSHYDTFRKEWDKNEKAIKYLDKEELTPEEIQYCIENYNPLRSRKHSVAGFARTFGVDEYTVRKQLSQVGLCTI